jgi:MFS family permease
VDTAAHLEHVSGKAASPPRHDTDAPAHEPSPRRRAVILGVASIASFMVALDLLVVTTALDTIRTELDASPAALQWTLTAYSVSFAGLLMAGAALGDRFGRRRVLALGLGVFVAGSVAAAVSTSVGRAAGANNMLQELGGAFGVAVTPRRSPDPAATARPPTWSPGSGPVSRQPPCWRRSARSPRPIRATDDEVR